MAFFKSKIINRTVPEGPIGYGTKTSQKRGSVGPKWTRVDVPGLQHFLGCTLAQKGEYPVTLDNWHFNGKRLWKVCGS